MERETNISVWQLRLFDGFDRDIMVMQRDDEEVFDGAVHVFFEKTYYDVYVAKAVKYGKHQYTYYEDKLGETVNMIFAEDIPGLVLHIGPGEEAAGNVLCDEKYIAQRELLGLKDIADSWHYMYTAATERCAKETAVARIWTKYVYIIGQLPDFRKKPGEEEQPKFELMTMKRKKDGQSATAEDYDYESLKIFLTADSAMHFNPDKKPVNKYKLAMLSQIVKGRFQVIVEPHRACWLEYDPAHLDLTGHLDIPRFDEENVRERIHAYTQMAQIYILLNPLYCDYQTSVGNPFLIKPDDKNIALFLFEKYEDAVSYVLQNPGLLPVFDSTFPIGVLDQKDNLFKLETVLALAAKLGVTGVNLDMDTLYAIGCKLDYFRKTAGYDTEVDSLLNAEESSMVVRSTDDGKQYRMPVVPFYEQSNCFNISDDRKDELAEHIDEDTDQGLAYLAGCSIPEMMAMMQETAKRFESARKEENQDRMNQYNLLMNKFTIPLTEALCEKPYIYTLREEDGSFSRRNNLIYLIVTNRYEAARKREGRLMPAGIDNQQFMEKLCDETKVAALTDGPNLMCLVDTRLMAEVAKQWKKAETLRAELMVYMTQGYGLAYEDAGYYYRRLKTDHDIFIEFVSTIRNGTYPPLGMLTIEGQTAKDIAQESDCDIPQAYDRLLSLKINPGSAKDRTDAETSAEGQKAEEKKGLFGKLFKK